MINCTSLTVDPGLQLRMSSCESHFGAKCNFSCTIGYRLNGSSTVTCVAPGNKPPGYWDSPLPSCEGMRERIYPWSTLVKCFRNITIFSVLSFHAATPKSKSQQKSRSCVIRRYHQNIQFSFSIWINALFQHAMNKALFIQWGLLIN